MERKRPYWQVAVSLMFSILATAAFIILGVKAIGFLMPFVVGWIISAIATPLVNWLEKRLKIVKKLGTAMIVIMVIGLIVLVGYFAVSRIAAEVTDLIQNFPDIYAQLEEGMREIGNTLDVYKRQVQDKDEVTLDFEGFVDGVAFEGGKGEDYPLTIGLSLIHI